MIGFKAARVARIIAAITIVAWAGSAAAQSADDIVAKNIAASGGEDALKGASSVKRTGKLTGDGMMGPMEGAIERVTLPGKKAFQMMDLGIMQIRTGFNGEVAWAEDAMQGLRELEGDEAAQATASLYLNPLLAAKESGDSTIAKLDDETVDEKAQYVLSVTRGDSVVKFYVDQATSLITQMVTEQDNPQMGGMMTITVKSADYADHGGLKLPNKEVMSMGDMLTLEFTFDVTEVGGDVDESIFDKPGAGQ